MQIQVSTHIAASEATIFALYANVAQWSVWDPDLKSSSLNGAVESGATGVVVPKSGPKSDVIFSDVILNRGFKVNCKLPLCAMRFEHELVPASGGTQVTHRVVFEVLLAPLFGRLIGSGMKKSLPHALAGLRTAALATK